MLPILDACTTNPFPAYRNTLRIRHATDLLREGAHLTTSIEGIAERSGFKSKSVLLGLQGRARDHACGLDQGEFVGSKKKNPMDQVHWVWGDLIVRIHFINRSGI